ncbi:MAG: enoyl-CoA hydratase [Planctomycetes bacterium]|nr:enoyl-CoA hydratase [Planctomycetota bacterium]
MTAAHLITRDAVGIVTLNRPDVLNAVDASTMDALESILDEIESDDAVRVVVLTAAGEGFCAGGDLDWFATLSPDEGVAMSLRMQSIMKRLADGSRPLIVAANGDALGGGLEILCAGHVRLAAAGARLGFRQAAMGLITGWGGGVRALRVLGRSRALELFLTARGFSPEDAVAWGLVHEVLAPEALQARALEIASQIAANSPRAIAAFLELVARFEDGNDAALAIETQLFRECWKGPWVRQRFDDWLRRREGD